MSNSPIHLVIIDAMNLIRRIHSVQSSPCLTTCLNSLNQIYQHSLPSHTVAIFDEKSAQMEQNNWRFKLYPDYKAGRKPMPSQLEDELASIKSAFVDHGVACWSQEDVEADDLIATLACKAAVNGCQVTVISTDKGYCQLQSTNIAIRDYFQRRWLDARFIQTEYGVSAQALNDYWGLAGISSSKIPGVPGIGPKSAAELIQRFATLDNLYQNIDDIESKWQNRLKKHQAQAYLSKTLATLKTDIHLGGNLSQLRFHYCQSHWD